MTSQQRTTLKLAAASILFIAAVVMGVLTGADLKDSGDEGLKVWFYDQSERRLYAVPRDTVPPHRGIGGAPDDGVRAIVVASPLQKNDPGKRRIAYLETCTPELKKLLEDLRAARRAGRRYEGALPDREGDFVHNNTLVRRPGEAQWYPASSAIGRQIMTEWRSCVGPDGQVPVVCMPD